MSFTLWYYPFFLGLVALLHWQLPRRGRIGLLLAASYVFYGVWDIRFLSLIAASTLSDFFSANAIEGRRRSTLELAAGSFAPVLWLLVLQMTDVPRAGLPGIYLLAAAAASLLFVLVFEMLWRLPEPVRRRGFLLLSLASNLGVLFFFKYFGFFVDSAKALLGAAGFGGDFTLLEILLPVGISFYTFQSIAYLVDVYRGQTRACTNLPLFATYIAFFPQLVAGPIERAKHLLEQLEHDRIFTRDDLHQGLRLLLVGYFKKIYVANNCAIVADYVFSGPEGLNAAWVLAGALAFAFQIYGDFSGYTDIARGSARLLGIRLSKNFDFPYSARGPSDFWSRWHITLSSWFRDYLYIPLGGNRGTRLQTLRNLCLTMLLAGLWHGAAWNFVV
ncbi:MAG: hypothetical protein L0Y32_01765, partial [Nevskiales bacterium]|nr:hypothetical protein [Nevskiales bacterium]